MRQLAGLILMVGAAFPEGVAAQAQYMGKSAPQAISKAGYQDQVANDLEAYRDDLPGRRVREVLGKDLKDRAVFLSRGRHDSEIYNAASPAVVIVVTTAGIGSGSYIGTDRILTNWHVVKDARQVGVFFKPRTEGARPAQNSLLMAQVVKVNATLDLALLQVSSPPQNVKPLSFGAETDIQVGADVHAIGHPTGEAWTYTKGIISQYRREYQWKTQEGSHSASVIQTQTPINPGNSGGPLLTDDGRIVGVNSFKSTGEGLNFAVSVVDVQKFLQSEVPAAESKAGQCQLRKIYEGRERQGLADLRLYDTNCDGKADISILTPDDQSKPISALIDSNFDGRTDITVEDRDRDKRWDISFHDVDFDGRIDLIGYHPDGKINPTRYEKYAAGKCAKNYEAGYAAGQCP